MSERWLPGLRIATISPSSIVVACFDDEICRQGFVGDCAILIMPRSTISSMTMWMLALDRLAIQAGGQYVDAPVEILGEQRDEPDAH